MLELYLYPIVLLEDDFDEDQIVAMIPDLGISTEGKNVEEAYLYAKDYLRVFIENALRYDIEFNEPSEISKVQNRYKGCQVMLVDSIIDTKRVRVQD